MREIIVALDMPDVAAATRFLDAAPAVRWVKIGPTLHLRGGHDFIDELKNRGLSVFLDLKWHDIPHQVAGAVRVADELGVDLATVHIAGGRAMIAAAVEAASTLRLAGVSVLTSHTAESYGEAMGRPTDLDVGAEVERLVTLGIDAGLKAFVCSPLEVANVRALTGNDAWRIVPGIRPGNGTDDDQSRTADPAFAVAAGATHLVVGRPIWRAESPARVYETMMELITNTT